MAGGDEKVFKQIEQTAGYYGAVTYTSLLSFYSNYAPVWDLGEFFPLTAVNTFRDQDRIQFAIGIIPPSADVTGKLLDRSASVLSVNGQEPGAVSEQAEAAASKAAPGTPNPDDIVKVFTAGSKAAGAHVGARQILTEAFTEVMGRPPTTAELQYLHAIGWLETSYGNGWKRNMVGSNNWGAVHCPMNAQDGPDCVHYVDHHPNGEEFKVNFKKYDTPKDGAKDLVKQVYKIRTTGKGLSGSDANAFTASYIMRREKYYGGFCPNATKQYGGADARASLSDPDRNEGTQACAQEAIRTHANLVKAIADDVAAANGDPSALALGSYADADQWWKANHGNTNGGAVKGDSNSGDWPGTGASAAKDAAKEQGKAGGTPLNSTDVGKQFQAAQKAQIMATQAALLKMASTPPLKMLVNPSKFGVKGEKITSDSNWGRNGPIIHHWGDGQDKISASGKVAGFYAIDTTNAGGPGLTRHARNFSESYANFQSLYQLYRNNGGLYLADPLTNGQTQNLSHVGSVYIYYDSTLYVGSFDTFSITESDATPFTLEYSFEFTVRAAFLLDRNDDKFTYGAPGFFPASSAPATTGPDLFNTPE